MIDDVLARIRRDYDALAPEYARRIAGELAHKPFDRDMLDRFAHLTRDRGPVCDLGCGPGHVARYLRDLNVDVFGVDLSPAMVAQARRLNPDVEFQEGNMLELAIATASLAGIAAFYAIVNLPKQSLPAAFAEMARTLQRDGLLLLAFHIGDEVIAVEELWGHPISMEFVLLEPSRIVRQLEAAGFTIEESVEREPYPDVEYPSRRAYILARRLRS